MSGAVNNQNAEALAAAAAAAVAASEINGNNEGVGRVGQDLPAMVQESADAAAAAAAPVIAAVAAQVTQEVEVAANAAALQVEEQQAAAPEVQEQQAAAPEVPKQQAAAPEVQGQQAAAPISPLVVVGSDSTVDESETVEDTSSKATPPLAPSEVDGSDSTVDESEEVVDTHIEATATPTPTGKKLKGDVRHTFTQMRSSTGALTWAPAARDPASSTPAEKAAKYITVGNLSTVLGIANEATKAAGLTGECVARLGTAGAFFKGANTAIGIADAGVKVIEAVDKGIAFAKDGKNLANGLAFGGAAANAAASGISATEKLASAGIVPISSEVNSILGGIGQGLKFVAGVFNIAEASKKLADNKFTVKGEKLSEILKIAAAVAVIFMAVIGIIALFGVALPALLLPIAGVVVAVSALASGIVKGIVSANHNKFAKSLLDGGPCAVAV